MNPNSTHESGVHEAQVLHSIVNRISAGSLAAATRKRSLIVNDVPHDLHVNTNEQMVATIFGALLNSLIMHTQNGCIRVSARLYGRVVLINLRESHQVNSPAFTVSLRQVQQLAEKIGGTVSISSDRHDATSIVFSFSNIPLAA